MVAINIICKEAKHKILSGHRITSPLLLGIRDTGGGFGNNADELRDSFDLLQGIVVQPFQDTMLNGLKKILSINNVDLDIYFKTLKPASFLDEEIIEVQSKDDAEKEGVSFKQDIPELDDNTGEELLTQLSKYQENIDDKEWFELGEMDVDEQEHEEHFEKLFMFQPLSVVVVALGLLCIDIIRFLKSFLFYNFLNILFFQVNHKNE